MTTPVASTPAATPAAAPAALDASGISANTSAAVAGMKQLAADGAALQMADLSLQTTVQPIKKLAGAAKDALS